MSKLHKLFICLLLVCFIGVQTTLAQTQTTHISIKVNGQEINSDVSAFLKEGRVFVPIRFVTESLNAEDIVWNEENKSITILLENNIYVMNIGEEIAFTNEWEYIMDVAPTIVDKRAFVPVRFVSEMLGCKVEWIEETKTVNISSNGSNEVKEVKEVEKPNYSEEDYMLLARIIEVEAGNLSIEGKLAVANVVLNRVKSPNFPSTINGVIYDTDGCVQFPPAHKASFKNVEPSKESLAASGMALEGNNNVEACLFFNNRPFRSKSDDLYKIIEGEYFYK